MSKTIIDVTEENFEAEVLKSNIPVLVDFWAEWCGPCKMLAPTLEQLALDKAGTLKVVKINVDHANALAVKYGVRGIPSMLLFKGYRVEATKIGAIPRAQIEAMLAPFL
jgi:thioredoxin 1